MNPMLVLSAAELQACDRATTEQHGIPSLQLMRSAGAAVAQLVQQVFPRAQRVTALCGRGNNGGDGMIAAHLLTNAGFEVTTLLLGDPERLSADAGAAWQDLLKQSAPSTAHVVLSAESLAAHAEALRPDLFLDALVGTGFTPPLHGLAASALAWVKESAAPVVAVDLPSGWAADLRTASSEVPVFPADAVVTFTAPKPAHLFGQLTRRWDQPVVVAPIGSPPEVIVSNLGLEWAGGALDLVRRPRAAEANKGNLAAATPELMTWPLAASPSGGISGDGLDEESLAELMEGKTLLAIGPGLGQAAGTAEFVTRLLTATRIPVVIDADALNILAAQPRLLEKVAAGRMVVMTPHPGEMARLAGISVAEVQGNRLNVARAFAQSLGVTLVLKGARTLIAHPDGRVAVNTSGNPGMAKGGSGDLLTGVIAGLLAQHPPSANAEDAARAVEAAVCLHGLAADLAVAEGDEHTLLATDCLRQFSRAFRFDLRGENGYVWLQGLPVNSIPSVCPPEAA
jgi:NAD(P)H-hydrate epimerase